MIKQISIFVENRQGTLINLLDVLKKANISIRALSLADTVDFGILRIIVDNTEKAIEVLKSNNILATTSDVIAIEVEDAVGGLCAPTSVLSGNNLIIEYMYAFVGTSNKNAIVIAKINDSEQALKVLKENNIKTLSAEEIIK